MKEFKSPDQEEAKTVFADEAEDGDGVEGDARLGDEGEKV